MRPAKFSVITVCYNAADSIAATIRSVLSQDYPQLEYIIVDGGSTDGTQDVIRSFGSEHIRLLSEKDEGLYDAINKGIMLSDGDIIALLHADDVFASGSVLSDIAALFREDFTLDAVSASVCIFKPGKPDKPYRVYRADRFRLWQFRLGIQPPHPGFFVSRKGFQTVGYYRTQYKISGDFDWLLRALWIYRLKVQYTERVAVHMRDGGLSSSGWKSKVQMNNEVLRILKIHGIYSNKFLVWSKYFFKLFQLRW